MFNFGTQALILGGALSATATAAHVACVFIGAPAYRLMGAGEGMARAIEAGKTKPTLVTLAIAAMLLVWSAYALSGAGVIGILPFTQYVLLAVCGVYLARAVGFPLLKSTFPENSNTFWRVSSGICLLIGLLHAYGIASLWATL